MLSRCNLNLAIISSVQYLHQMQIVNKIWPSRIILHSAVCGSLTLIIISARANAAAVATISAPTAV